ncbi:MAG: hypothetical protein IIY93_04560 [Clostridia bacterium]|nr:hypothetical protein [Clostridia bacterium]
MKKTIAILLEILPIVSAPLAYLLVISDYNSPLIRAVIGITFLIAFLGFVFFLIGRKLSKGDKVVRILGIIDCIATLFIVAIYVIAIFNFGL